MISITKKAQSTGFAWLVGLIMIFSVGLLYVVFNQVIQVHLIPVSQTLANQSVSLGYVNQSTANANMEEVSKANSHWTFLPILFVVLIILFMVARTLYNQREEAY